MHELHGTGIGRGVVFGPVLRMSGPLAAPSGAPRAAEVDAEQTVAADALNAVAGELSQLAEKLDDSAREVLDAQALMANDPALLVDIKERITSGSTAERAVFEAFAAFQETLTAMGGYLAERAADLGDVAQRTIAQIRGVSAPGVPTADHPFVLVAHDLAPADTATLDLGKVIAFVTSAGGPTSHTAILARAKAITAIVGVDGAEELVDGTPVLVDAEAGTVTISPTESEISAAEARAEKLKIIASAPITNGALADGEGIPLLANLGSPEDAADAVKFGAEGVGLLRTEFLFLDSESAPTVPEQVAAYSAVFHSFEGKKVIVRCLDAGADKPLKFLNDTDEDNPALGLRGLRALRKYEQILREQLNALARAQTETGADLWVMAPMVSDIEETEYFVSFAKEADLRVVGVMAEVPSLALMADQVAAACDFVSIGTNDLTQYTMAADRTLGSVAQYQDPWHPAVLRLIKMIGDAGGKTGKPVGVCGEAAADPLLALVLVGLGATSLSMAPRALADVRAVLRKYTKADTVALGAAALSAPTAAAARAAAAAITPTSG